MQLSAFLCDRASSGYEKRARAVQAIDNRALSRNPEVDERTSAIVGLLLASGRAAFLKSFGRRRRTKVLDARTRGSQAMSYGVFGLGWVGMLIGAARVLSSLEADRSGMSDGRGRPGADRRAPAGMAAPLARIDASPSVPRSIVDAGLIDIGLCRVTAPASRITLHELVGRGAGAGVRRSR